MARLRWANDAPDGLSATLPQGFEPGRTLKKRLELVDPDPDGPVTTILVKGRKLAYDDEGAPVAGTVRSIALLDADGDRLLQIGNLDFPASLFGWFYGANQTGRLAETFLAGGAAITGGRANDVLVGGAGKDTIKGGAGADFIVPLGGADRIDGGAGFDQLSYAETVFFGETPQRGIRLDLARETVIDTSGKRDRFDDIEAVRMSLADDQAKGSRGSDLLRPLLGDDTIDGRAGIDTVAYDDDAGFGGMDGVTVNLQRGRATDGFGTEDRLKRVENVIGTSFDDAIVGSNADNLLQGGNGDDTLEGKRGEDTLSGFDGTDRFVFADRPGDIDVVADFETGVDTLAFKGSRYGGLDAGALPAGAFVSADEPAPTTTGPTFLYDADGGILGFDQDGTGPAPTLVLMILSGVPALSADDIVIF